MVVSFLMDLRGIPPAALAAFQASSAPEGPPDLPASADFVCSLLVRFPSLFSLVLLKKLITINMVVSFLMDLRGIEPLSENLFRAVSPITVFILTFPPCGV